MFQGRVELRSTPFSVELGETNFSKACRGPVSKHKTLQEDASPNKRNEGHRGLDVPSRTSELSFLTGSLSIINISPNRIGTGG